jgi:hypothetical protein
MNGKVALNNMLEADSIFIALLTDGVNSIAVGIKEPTSWGVNDKTCSIYSGGIVENSLNHLETELTANCRAGTEGEAEEIATAFVNAVDRKDIPDGGVFMCTTLPTIPPEDDSDSFNIPITVKVLAGKELI